MNKNKTIGQIQIEFNEKLDKINNMYHFTSFVHFNEIKKYGILKSRLITNKIENHCIVPSHEKMIYFSLNSKYHDFIIEQRNKELYINLKINIYGDTLVKSHISIDEDWVFLNYFSNKDNNELNFDIDLVKEKLNIKMKEFNFTVQEDFLTIIDCLLFKLNLKNEKIVKNSADYTYLLDKFFSNEFETERQLLFNSYNPYPPSICLPLVFDLSRTNTSSELYYNQSNDFNSGFILAKS